MASTSQTWKDKILRKNFKHKAIFPKVFFFIKMDHYRLKSVTWSVCVWHRIFKSLIKYHPFLLRRAGGPGQKKKSFVRELGANFIISYQIHILDIIKFYPAKLLIWLLFWSFQTCYIKLTFKLQRNGLQRSCLILVCPV